MKIVSGLTLYVVGLPIAQPRQRTGIHRWKDKSTGEDRAMARNYTKKDHPVNAWKAAVVAEAIKAVGGHDSPLRFPEGPLEVEMVFAFPRPASFPKRAPAFAIPKANGPDCDNLAKAVLDALNLVLWHDDSQIASLLVTKMIAPSGAIPRAEITVRPILGTMEQVVF